jgi:hypothetical protein
MTENTENVVPFVDRPAPQLMSGQRRRDYPPARTRAAKRYVDMLEACSTPLRLEALEILIGSIDLAGLEYVLHDGELMGVIGEVVAVAGLLGLPGLFPGGSGELLGHPGPGRRAFSGKGYTAGRRRRAERGPSAARYATSHASRLGRHRGTKQAGRHRQGSDQAEPLRGARLSAGTKRAPAAFTPTVFSSVTRPRDLRRQGSSAARQRPSTRMLPSGALPPRRRMTGSSTLAF